MVTKTMADETAKADVHDCWVPRCGSCGSDVPAAGDDSGHREHSAALCDRGGGLIIMCHPRGCAIDGCKVHESGQLFRSLSNTAMHAQWHLTEWDKEDRAGHSLVVSAPAPVRSRTVDRWGPDELTLDTRAKAKFSAEAPAPGAVCVAFLFASQDLRLLVAECCDVGEVPLVAYSNAHGFAVVPVDGRQPGKSISGTIRNVRLDGTYCRVGTRWEISEDG